MLGDEGGTDATYSRPWLSATTGSAIFIIAGIAFIVAVIALVFALLRHRSELSVDLQGDVLGPSDGNYLRTINAGGNSSCPAGSGTFQTCGFITDNGLCHEPQCIPVGGVLGPANGTTINGTYPNIDIVVIGNGGECGDVTTGADCVLVFDKYGRIVNATNGTTTNNILNVNITNSTTITGTVGVPELKSPYTPFNCTGGDTLCQVGRDAHGLVVLIGDGPTCLPNTTVLAGVVTGPVTNTVISNSGIGPGCYGNVTNQSVTVARTCYGADGRATSVTTQTLALVFTNGTFGLVSTANETTVTDLGGNTFQIGTIQRNDKEADLQFRRILLSPATSQTVNTANSSYTLGVLGTTGTGTTPLIGVYDTANAQGVPELQLGIWNDTATTRHPFISFNTYWNPVTNTWESSVANTTGFVIFDPHAGGNLYFSVTTATPVANQSTTLAVDVARMQTDLFTSFQVFRVGIDPPAPLIDGGSGFQNVYAGLTNFDLPRYTSYMTYANTYPAYQQVVFDRGFVYQLYEGYIDAFGTFRCSNNVINPGVFYYTDDGAFHFIVVNTTGEGGDMGSFSGNTMDITGSYVNVFKPFFLGSDESRARQISMNAIGTNDMSLGFGMFKDFGGWKFGDTLTPGYAFWKSNDKLSLLRADVASFRHLVSPATLMTVNGNETDWFLRMKLYGPNADIWGFVCNASLPEWQVYSGGIGDTGFYMDAWVNSGTVTSGAGGVDGARIYKTNGTLWFQRFTDTTPGAAFATNHTMMSMSGQGINVYPTGTQYGLQATIARNDFGGVLEQTYGSYVDELGIVRQGTSVISNTYVTTYGLGALSIEHCAGAAQGSPIGLCTVDITLSSGTITMGTPTIFSAGATFSSTATFNNPVTFNGSPQLSNCLQVTSGGIGICNVLAGGRLMVSVPGANGGSIVESNASAPDSDTAFAQTVFFEGSGGTCSGTAPYGFATTAISFARFNNVTTVQTYFGLSFDPADKCGVGQIMRFFVEIPAGLATRFPPPISNIELTFSGAQASRRWTMYGSYFVDAPPRLQVELAESPGISNFIPATTYTLPQTLVFTYINHA